MPEPHTFALFAAASLAFIAVPGPSVIYIVSRSLAEGRRAGIVSALGIQTGGLVHVLAATIGVSALLASSASSSPSCRSSSTPTAARWRRRCSRSA